MSPASDTELIEWWLRFLNQEASELTEREAELVMSFEKQFDRNNKLSPRQMEILEEIYKRRT